ncbi:MAG TPA: nitrogenase component I subunit alpha [Halobacteria archaeon]|jgi:nitrogenase molybdenum-iron protein alpha chain|nr:nitrogenase component I subunit alpha [Halobacteria archaeon]
MPLTLLNCDKSIPERKKHTYVKDSTEEILPLCNIQTTPGDFTERGCTYAGCMGVVGGPVKDVIHLVHGPIGCAYWTWGGGTRPNLSDNPQFHQKYCFSTDMQEKNIIFGGNEKLYNAIIESYKEFPEAKGVFVYATCTIGLIGDDIKAVCKQAEEEIGIKVVGFNCEGFRGCSQSLGHHIANDTLFEQVVGTKEPEYTTDYDMNIMGDYNIKGDLWVIKPLFERMGIRILSTFTGNSSIDDIAQAHRAKLNLMHCQRSTPYICELIKEKYGIPYIKESLFGIEQTSKALRDVAAFFRLEEKAEEVIADEVSKIDPKIEEYRRKFEGKRIFIYQGAPRAWHWVRMFREIGIETIAAATTFGHEEDYAKICERVKDGTIIIDNPNAIEIEEILTELRPDIFISGLKEKYLAYKLGIPFINGHSYETGPYAGYSGLLNFAKDIEKAIFAPVWSMIRRRDAKCNY